MQVIVTRAKEDCPELTKKLEEQGIEYKVFPCINYNSPSDNYQALDKAIRSNHEYDWLFFLSRRAAESFFNRLLELGGHLFHLSPHLKIACVGPATAKFITDVIGFPVDFIPSQFNSETLFAEFKHKYSGRILLVREESLSEVPSELDITIVTGYQSKLPEKPTTTIKSEDLITITSSQIAKNFYELTQGDVTATQFISIGPQTTATLKALYPQATITESKESTIDSMLEQIRTHKMLK